MSPICADQHLPCYVAVFKPRRTAIFDCNVMQVETRCGFALNTADAAHYGLYVSALCIDNRALGRNRLNTDFLADQPLGTAIGSE